MIPICFEKCARLEWKVPFTNTMQMSELSRLNGYGIPYIPLGKLTVLQGDPGEGKSTFALNVVARITTGQPMPDGVFLLKESVLRSISVLKTVLQIQ